MQWNFLKALNVLGAIAPKTFLSLKIAEQLGYPIKLAKTEPHESTPLASVAPSPISVPSPISTPVIPQPTPSPEPVLPLSKPVVPICEASSGKLFKRDGIVAREGAIWQPRSGRTS